MNVFISIAGLLAYLVAIVATFADNALWFRIGILVVIFVFVTRLTNIEKHVEGHGQALIDHHLALRKKKDL